MNNNEHRPVPPAGGPRCHDCGQPLRWGEEVRANGGYCYECGPGSARAQERASKEDARRVLARPAQLAGAGELAVLPRSSAVIPGAGQLAPDLAAAIVQLAAAAAAQGLRAVVEFSPAAPAFRSSIVPGPATDPANPRAPWPAPDPLGELPATDCPACFVVALGHGQTDEEHTCGAGAASVAPAASTPAPAAPESAPATNGAAAAPPPQEG